MLGIIGAMDEEVAKLKEKMAELLNRPYEEATDD